MKFWGIRLGSMLAALSFCLILDKLSQGVNDYQQRLIVLACLYVTLSVSLNLINGITGQFSIGHAAFYMVGAYTAGYVTNSYFANQGIHGAWWALAMMLAGACTAAIAGLIVGLPSLRLKGDYLAIVTMGFGEILRIIVQASTPLGGSYGMKIKPQFEYVWMVAMLAIVCIAVCRNLLKTAHGLSFLAVREDEVASSAMGVNVTQVKVFAFVLGSAFAGAAGAIYAVYDTFITPSTFSMAESFMILTMVVLGGTGSVTGSVLSAIVLFELPEQLRNAPDVNAATVAGAFISLVLCLAAIKRIEKRGQNTKLQRSMMYLGSIGLALLLTFILSKTFGIFPAMKLKTFKASDLRWPIFSLTLIILMLVRPQGIFAHHEFSWRWLQSLFQRKRAKAVEA